MSHCQNISNNAATNARIKQGDWFDCDVGIMVEGMTLGNLKKSLAVSYGYKTAILDHLVLR